MKRSLLAVLAVAALAGGLSACETATPYQPLNPADAAAGGYRDARLDADHWRVSFSGNSVTSRETVERYLLYRAAELTAGQGYDWFMETDQHTDRRTDVYVDPYYGYGWRPYWSFRRRGFRGGFYGGWGPGWGPYDPWGPGFATEFDRFEVSAEIMAGHGPKPPQALDARQVLGNLGPSIQRPGQPAAPTAPPPPSTYMPPPPPPRPPAPPTGA